MASLEKLSISGIRSFGTEIDDWQSISFGKPLTLILGDNGCGKSTIIECLRYITTQKEPSGKGVFVHDPNLTNYPTVKAFVKLHLKDSKKESVHLCKSLQATRNRKSITMKNLDSTISRIDPTDPTGGKLMSISNRCADLVPEIMRILGVSRAILENVIFCTQEDAHWPLDTDQKLKEKFDQIFNLDKYNKCLKKVREHRKEIVIKKTNCVSELKHLKERKEFAAEKRVQLQDLENEVHNLDEEMKMLDESLVPIRDQMKTVAEQEKEFSKVYTACETTKTELKGVEKVAQDLESKIRLASCEFIGTNDELEEALLECDVQARNVNELNAELVRYKTRESALSKEMGESVSRKGQLTKTIEIYKTKLQEKAEKMRKLATECGINSSHLSEDGLERRLVAKKSEFNQLQADLEAKEDQLRSEVEKARDAVKAKSYDVKRLADAVDENAKMARDLQRELQDEETTQTRRERISAELRQAEQALAEHKRQGNEAELSASLERCQTELQLSEAGIAELDESIQRLQQHAETGSTLALRRGELQRKKTEMTRLRNSHREALLDILQNLPDKGFKRAVEDQAEQLQTKLSHLRVQKAAKEREINGLRNSNESLMTKIVTHRSDADSFMTVLNREVAGEYLPQVVERLETRVSSLQDEKGVLTSSEYMLNRYISNMQRTTCCPLCHRDFAAEEEARSLIDELNRKKREIPANLDKVTRDLQTAQDKLRTLLPLVPDLERTTKLKEETIPDLLRKQDEMQVKINATVRDLDSIDQELTRTEKDRDTCTGLLADMGLLDHLISDISKLQTEVEKLEMSLPTGWSVDTLKEEVLRRDGLRIDRRRQNSNRDEAQRKLNEYNTKLAQLQGKKHNLAEEELKLRGSGGQRQQQEDRMNSLKMAEVTLLKDLQAARDAMRPLEEVCSQRGLDYIHMKAAHKEELKQKQAQVDGLFEQLKEIRRLQREVLDFEGRGEEQELADVIDTIRQKEDAIRAIKIQIENTSAQLGEKSKSIVRRRELDDNKALREKQSEIERLKIKLKSLESKFGNMGYETLLKEKKRLRDEEEKIGHKKATCGGQKGAIQGQIAALEKELRTTMYRDIDAKFKKEVCQMKIFEGLASDMLRYVTAMDYAMNVYHQRQMERVNAIVREYWRKIYRGNDVDYIEVQAEQAELTETRRSFNYKLVQVKGDVRLEMRNRCSAGQKMLASLIIRMGLAEVFSNNCGILTLDEPTTNLDRKNIRNLANTLNELIAAKQSLPNTNFQLIVITHDKDFLNELITVNEVDRYVEVSRNRDGKSQLTIRNVDRS